jgi:ribosomal protein L37AE/L43A
MLIASGMNCEIVKRRGPHQRRVNMDEKDRLGAKLREKEKAEEDRYFAQRDKELLEKLKQQQAAPTEAVQQQALMHCPKCATKLNTVKHHDVTVDECPSCQGMWLDRGELEILAQREHEGWLGRFFRRGVLRQD